MLLIGVVSFDFAISFALGYLFGTFLCGPDLDTKSSLYRRWGALRFVWYPYRKLFPHRSIFTHWFVLGDLIRLGYLALWLFPFILMDFLPLRRWLTILYEQYPYAIWFFPIGVVVSSVVHISSDVLVSGIKKIVK